MARSPDELALANEVQARIREDVEGIVERLLAANRRHAPEFAQDAELWAAMRETARRDVLGGLRAAERGAVPEALPVEASAFAELAARSGMPLATLLQAWRIGGLAWWEEICRIVDEIDAPLAAKYAVIRDWVTDLLRYGDRVSTLISQDFAAEWERLRRTQQERRLGLVREVLAGRRVDTAQLAYDLRGGHVGLVALGIDAEAALRELAGLLGRVALVVNVDDSAAWAWLSGAPLDDAALAGWTGRPGCHVGLGGVARGREGFVRTHDQAAAAARLGRQGGRRLTRFDAVALEWLAGRDEQAAALFVAEELGPLAQENARAARLRATLSAYLDAGQNASATAARIGVSVRTVSYRMRSIEEALGRPVASRSAELQTALRLAAAGSSSPPRP